VYRVLKMTKKLAGSSLAAAFAFGTAFGLAVAQTRTTNCQKPTSKILLDDFANSSPKTQSQAPQGAEKHDSLVCLESSDGQALCWPKGSEPGGESETACIECDGTTLCANKADPGAP
jgi:hypothetical protein